MGYFGAFLFDGRSWTDAEADNIVPSDAEYWLHVDIHDSDIATITYNPAGPGSGVAYLGLTPRTYFEDPNASLPTDAHREAAGLAAWWAGRQDGATDADRDAKTASLRPYLAEDLGPKDNDSDDEEDEEEEDRDDASIFVEIKTDRFLVTLGLPPLRMAG
ncbi:hypothetical protein [Dactylosporangium salmoneum]|uniref:Uncharacterized protein n=1 Tax=Dactylosporangium salmoneum TaxID=53361 RepID=A0ABP5UNB4_9ACTN